MSETETETLATVTCLECPRTRRRGETWILRFSDIGEVVIYCPECAEREFGTTWEVFEAD